MNVKAWTFLKGIYLYYSGVFYCAFILAVFHFVNNYVVLGIGPHLLLYSIYYLLSSVFLFGMFKMSASKQTVYLQLFYHLLCLDCLAIGYCCCLSLASSPSILSPGDGGQFLSQLPLCCFSFMGVLVSSHYYFGISVKQPHLGKCDRQTDNIYLFLWHATRVLWAGR